jgi:DNA-binding NtrC family response regulator
MKKIMPLRELIDEAVQTATKAALPEALAQTGNHVTEGAQLLKISRYAAYRVMRRCGLEFSPRANREVKTLDTSASPSPDSSLLTQA